MELNETDVLMLRKLEEIREHFPAFDYDFRALEAKFINSCTYEGKTLKDRNEFEHLIKGDLEEYRNPIEYPKEWEGKKVYGMEDWKTGFHDDFKPGDYFNAEVAEYFLNVVPPRKYSSIYIQCGEPYSSGIDSRDDKRKFTYTTFEAVKGDINDIKSVWKYCGTCFAGDKEEQ